MSEDWISQMRKGDANFVRAQKHVGFFEFVHVALIPSEVAALGFGALGVLFGLELWYAGGLMLCFFLFSLLSALVTRSVTMRLSENRLVQLEPSKVSSGLLLPGVFLLVSVLFAELVTREVIPAHLVYLLGPAVLILLAVSAWGLYSLWWRFLVWLLESKSTYSRVLEQERRLAELGEVERSGGSGVLESHRAYIRAKRDALLAKKQRLREIHEAETSILGSEESQGEDDE